MDIIAEWASEVGGLAEVHYRTCYGMSEADFGGVEE